MRLVEEAAIRVADDHGLTHLLRPLAQRLRRKIKSLDVPANNALTNYLVSLLQSRWRGYAMRLEYEKNAGMASERVKPTQVAPDPEA